MYDPLELARHTARIVCRGTARKYYRFRSARFYSGIATADCLGCNLRCTFCWAWEQVHQVDRLGEFYEPLAVAERLGAIAREKGSKCALAATSLPWACRICYRCSVICLRD